MHTDVVQVAEVWAAAGQATRSFCSAKACCHRPEPGTRMTSGRGTESNAPVAVISSPESQRTGPGRAAR